MSRALEWERTQKALIGAEGVSQRKIRDLVAMAGELAEKSELSADRAQSLIREILEVSTGEKLANYSTREWLGEWLEMKSARTKERTMQRYQLSVRAFVKFLGPKADLGLEHVTESDVREFRDGLWKAGRTQKTANNYAKDIASGFLRAQRAGLINRNPCATLERLPEEDSTSRQPFTLEEIQALLKAASTPWRGLILLGLYGGLRLGDAARLKWANVDLMDRVIRYQPEKTSRKKVEIILPMHPQLEAFFHELNSPDDPETFVFPEFSRKSTGGRVGLSDLFHRLMKKAGVGRAFSKEANEGAGRRASQKTFHSLRHSAASFMANADVSEELRRAIVGHSSERVHRIYTTLELETLRGAVNAIPEVSK
ncbi:MAG: site-specific integrase [Verrucomicrobiota bacterium]